MNIANRILSTYTADVSGVCSALYELGGMCVIHDASGCNSTYNTHDEPRWYDMDSLVYISALTESDAILGADDKLIRDTVTAANELHPSFIALAGTPIPMLCGTDFHGIAAQIEHETGLPTFGFDTNGMHSYISGAGMALEAVAERLVSDAPQWSPHDADKRVRVNLLGVTPLDFSIVGNAEALRAEFAEHGFDVTSCWAMGSTLDKIRASGSAEVNAVVSMAGLLAAKALKRRFGTPYMFGVPIGSAGAEEYFNRLRTVAETGRVGAEEQYTPLFDDKVDERPLFVIGEAISAASLRRALEHRGEKNVKVLCPLEVGESCLRPGDIAVADEKDIEHALSSAREVIADPLYKPAIPQCASFISLPHEAYSGRIYRSEIPILIGDRFDKWIKER